MLHKHCIFIPFDGFENLKFFSQFCEKIKPDPILNQFGQALANLDRYEQINTCLN